MAGPVPVDPLAHGKGAVRVLLVPILNHEVVHALEVLHSTPAYPHPGVIIIIIIIIKIIIIIINRPQLTHTLGMMIKMIPHQE